MIMTRLSVLLVVLSLVLLSAGCVKYAPLADEDRWTIPPSQYVFIDRHVSQSGEVINGSCTGGLMIDFPTYSFNRDTKELSGISTHSLEVNNTLKIIYGDGMSLGGDLGGGAATGLIPVYALPFEEGSVIIRGVSPDGLAILAAGNETIALPAGETWTNTSVTTGSDPFAGSDSTCTIRITRTETIYNAGIVDKSLIRKD